MVLQSATVALVHVCLFFFHAPATTEIYTLSLHDALPICRRVVHLRRNRCTRPTRSDISNNRNAKIRGAGSNRSEEHTSELQSRRDLVCRLLLEKKKKEHPVFHSPSTLTTTRTILILHRRV